MTDIVARLRLRASGGPVRGQLDDEAADEIERLRALGPEDDWEERGAADAMHAEIERLRALLRAIMDDTSDGQESMSDDIRDRIERALEPKP